MFGTGYTGGDPMKAQTPAEGILKRSEWGSAKSYQITCECGDDKHDHNVWVEADESRVTVTNYVTVKSKWWELNRWETIWTLLIKGYVECESTIIMSQQQALNYAKTLESAMKDVEEFRNAQKSNNKH